MNLSEIAAFLDKIGSDEQRSQWLVLALADAVREYRPRTHFETYALSEIFEKVRNEP